ncbi:MAG: hypothetical protein WC006_03225 [Bacilli bacterium]|nr:hypothetical protein [Bacilli bacterium]
MEIIKVDESNLEMISKFLNSLEIINDINKDVVLNGSYVFEDEVVGFLSFEEFNKIGLIRYFVFKKMVDHKIVMDLFNKVCLSAKKKNIDTLITLVVKEEAISVFRELGFTVADKKDVYIEEININDTRFKDAIVLKYSLK